MQALTINKEPQVIEQEFDQAIGLVEQLKNHAGVNKDIYAELVNQLRNDYAEFGNLVDAGLVEVL